MLGFEPRISGVGSDRSANWATTTAQPLLESELVSLTTGARKLDIRWKKINARGEFFY